MMRYQVRETRYGRYDDRVTVLLETDSKEQALELFFRHAKKALSVCIWDTKEMNFLWDGERYYHSGLLK